jgi:hypothetical protein
MLEIRQKKIAEQAEDSSPNPSSSACDIRIQKRLAECFAKSFPQKIVFAKPSPHQSRHLPEYLEGRTPKKNVLSFLEEIGRAQIRKARNIFLWCPPRLCEAVAGLIHSFSFRSKKVRAKCMITAQNKKKDIIL